MATTSTSGGTSARDIAASDADVASTGPPLFPGHASVGSNSSRCVPICGICGSCSTRVEVHVPGDDVKHVFVHCGGTTVDTGTTGLFGQGANGSGRVTVQIDLEEVRQCQKDGLDFAVLPNGHVFWPCADRELVKD